MIYKLYSRRNTFNIEENVRYQSIIIKKKHFFKARTAANQLILFHFCFIIQRKAKIRLLFINKKFVFISKRFIMFYSLKKTKYSLIFY